MDDLQIRDMIFFVIKYLNQNFPENLDIMIHLIGHDERYRKRVEEITESIIDHHDDSDRGLIRKERCADVQASRLFVPPLHFDFIVAF